MAVMLHAQAPQTPCTTSNLNASYIDSVNNVQYLCTTAGWKPGVGIGAPTVACSANNLGSTYLDVSSGAVYTCNNGTWSGGSTLPGHSEWYAVNYLKCDDTTDDTAAFNSLLSTVYTARGGTIVMPQGSFCLMNSAEVTFPNSGAVNPTQPAIRITGQGSSANGTWGTLPQSGGFDLRFNAPDAKLVTVGVGKLEIDHLTIKDGGSDCAPFILTTGTTLSIHDNSFSGTASGSLACNDALVLGGTTTTTGTNNPSGAFQGYGTDISNNFFDQIRRLAFLRTFANGVTIRANTISSSGGNSAAHGSAIQIDSTATPGQSNVGNVVRDNVQEATNYVHFVNCLTCVSSTFAGNNSYDNGGSWLSQYYMQEAGGFNLLISGYEGVGGVILSGPDTTSTVVDSGQSRNSTFQGIVASSISSTNNITATNDISASTITANSVLRAKDAGGDVFRFGLSSATVAVLQLEPAGGGITNEFFFQDGNGGAVGNPIPWLIMPSSIESIIDAGSGGGTVPLLIRATSVQLGGSTGSFSNGTQTWTVDHFGMVHQLGTAPTSSLGSITGTNNGGFITGLSAATSLTITFANSGWSAWASCTANSSVASTQPYVSAISTTAVTFTFPSLTGNLYYHCDGN